MKMEALSEREKWQREIEQIKQALQAGDASASSEDDSENDEDDLLVDTDNEFPNENEESQGAKRDNESTPQTDTKDFHSVDDGASDWSTYQIEDQQRREVIHLHLDNGDLPKTPEASLVLNRAYQEIITDTINQVQQAIERNKTKQQEIQNALVSKCKKQKLAKKGRSLMIYTVPYFKDIRGMLPPQNRDVLERKRDSRWVKEQIRNKVWNSEDKETLYNAVKADCIQQLTRPLMNQREIEHEKLNKTADPLVQNQIKERLSSLSEQIQAVAKKPDIELFDTIQDEDKIDWLKISSIDFDGKASPINCQLQWSHRVHPRTNCGKWTAEEDKKLCYLARKHNHKNWKMIADELGTYRKPFQCIERYQTKFNKEPFKIWTPQENEQLLEAVKLCTYSGVINWSEVPEYLPGRLREHCYKRYERINPELKRGRWTEEEDMKLLTAVNRCGERWVKVAKYIPGRNHNQCRERYANTLDPSLNMGNWTYDEDKKLLQLVEDNPFGAWAKVAQSLPGRTDNMVTQRWRRLMTYKAQGEWIVQQSEAYQAAILKFKNVTKSVNSLVIHRDGTSQKVSLKLNVPEGLSEVDKKYQKYMHNMLLCRLILEPDPKKQAELYQMKLDIDKGIIVPRHPEMRFSTRNNNKQALRRQKMYNMLSNKLKKIVEKETSTAEETDEIIAINPQLEAKLKKLPGDLQKRIQTVGLEKMTVKELLMISQQVIKKNRGKGSIGRPKKLAKEAIVDNTIIKMLSERSQKYAKAGRPRKSKVTIEDDTEETRATREKNVGALLLQAMHIDAKSCLPQGKYMIRRKRLEQEYRTTHKKNSNTESNRRKKTTERIRVSEYIAQVEHNKSMEEFEIDLQLVERILNKGPSASATDTGAHSSAEIPVTPPSENVSMREYIEQKLGPPPPLPIKSHGNYALPPLPPTLSTLKGFTSLLLQRRNFEKLVKQRSSSESQESCADSGPTRDQQMAPWKAAPWIKLPASVLQSHDYRQLRSRFFSMFLWPAFLSALELPKIEMSEGWTAPTDTRPQPSAAAGGEAVAMETEADHHPHKTKNNHRAYKKKYPCTKGGRFRKFAHKRRDEKVELVSKFLSRGPRDSLSVKAENEEDPEEDNVGDGESEKQGAKKGVKRRRKDHSENARPRSTRIQSQLQRKIQEEEDQVTVTSIQKRPTQKRKLPTEPRQPENEDDTDAAKRPRNDTNNQDGNHSNDQDSNVDTSNAAQAALSSGCQMNLIQVVTPGMTTMPESCSQPSIILDLSGTPRLIMGQATANMGIATIAESGHNPQPLISSGFTVAPPSVGIGVPEQTNVQINVQSNIQANVQNDLQTNDESIAQTNVQNDIQTNGRNDIQTNDQTNVQSNIQTNVETDIQISLQTNEQDRLEHKAQQLDVTVDQSDSTSAASTDAVPSNASTTYAVPSNASTTDAVPSNASTAAAAAIPTSMVANIHYRTLKSGDGDQAEVSQRSTDEESQSSEVVSGLSADELTNLVKPEPSLEPNGIE